MPKRPIATRFDDPTCDTSPEAAAVQASIYRAMPAWRKIELVGELNKTARVLAMAGLRQRHPDRQVC